MAGNEKVTWAGGLGGVGGRGIFLRMEGRGGVSRRPASERRVSGCGIQ